MKIPKGHKLILVIGAGLLVLQVPWFFVMQAIVGKTQTKTVATVIRIESREAGCTGDQAGRVDPTCDHSARQFPVYGYYDAAGRRHEQDDKSFGEYKTNNPLRKLFWKDVGAKVPVYYTTDKPQEALFMAGPLAYTPWLVPLYLAVPMLAVWLIFYIVNKIDNLL